MNEYAKKMIQKDPMMYVNANGGSPLPRRLMRHEFEQEGRYGRVRSIYPGTSFDGGMPGQGEQMPGVEEMVARFRGGRMGQAGGGYPGMDEQQSDDLVPMSTGLAEQVGNRGEMNPAAKEQRELIAETEVKQAQRDLAGYNRQIQGDMGAIRQSQQAEQRPGMKMPDMEMGADESSRRAAAFKQNYLRMLLS